jgi:hypothetical protein
MSQAHPLKSQYKRISRPTERSEVDNGSLANARFAYIWTYANERSNEYLTRGKGTLVPGPLPKTPFCVSPVYKDTPQYAAGYL